MHAVFSLTLFQEGRHLCFSHKVRPSQWPRLFLSDLDRRHPVGNKSHESQFIRSAHHNYTFLFEGLECTNKRNNLNNIEINKKRVPLNNASPLCR